MSEVVTKDDVLIHWVLSLVAMVMLWIALLVAIVHGENEIHQSGIELREQNVQS